MSTAGTASSISTSIIAIEKRLKVKFATAEISRLKENEFKYWNAVGVGGPKTKSSAMTLASLELPSSVFAAFERSFSSCTDDFVAAKHVGRLQRGFPLSSNAKRKKRSCTRAFSIKRIRGRPTTAQVAEPMSFGGISSRTGGSIPRPSQIRSCASYLPQSLAMHTLNIVGLSYMLFRQILFFGGFHRRADRESVAYGHMQITN